MQPHIDEAWRSLRLADRDIVAFNILRQQPEAHVSIVNFHAQQAVEKSLKAVLYSRRIEVESSEQSRFGGLACRYNTPLRPSRNTSFREWSCPV